MTKLMEINQRMEQLSFAYVKIICSTAGFALARPSVDDDSVDLTIYSRSGSRPRVDLQIKSTSRDNGNDNFRFRLPRKNYDDLRITNVMVPRLLVVVTMPQEITDWITISRKEETTILGCMAYWCSLHGMPDRNQESITVKIPREQVLDPDTLNELISRVEVGRRL
ncbi:DUF4365 domain-containing protein [Sulfobacillus thermosulfidooxidans]|uniref:DUF4365 domain-containing protein n=1 Tax=Sulfobacillus thermosulfidooxidans TaxID=28034 RepID=UPI0006B4E026